MYILTENILVLIDKHPLCMSVCPYIRPSICLSVHPFIHLSMLILFMKKKTIYLSWILAFATHSYTLARQTLNRVNRICRSLICVSILVLDNNLKICSQLWINMGVYILSVGFKLCWLNKCGTNCTGQY